MFTAIDKDHNGWEHVEQRLQKYMIIQDLKWVSKDEVFTQDVVCDVDVGFLAQAQYDRMAGQQATLPFVNLHQDPYVKLFFGKQNNWSNNTHYYFYLKFDKKINTTQIFK
mgnify:CR=1 FL=1